MCQIKVILKTQLARAPGEGMRTAGLQDQEVHRVSCCSHRSTPLLRDAIASLKLANCCCQWKACIYALHSHCTPNIQLETDRCACALQQMPQIQPTHTLQDASTRLHTF
jgi:hypothetical protein